MRTGEASKTAMGAATHRAFHQVVDDPVLFEDPYALAILGLQPQHLSGHPYAQRGGMRSHIVGRSLFAEETLARAVQRGVRQYVLLGAGLDTFALRNPHLGKGLAVFEVDNPDSQAFKRERLALAKAEPVEPPIYVPIDFEKETLAYALTRAGFDLDRPAVFAWLGVVPYLTWEAVTATLKAVGSLAPGTEIVFDCGEDPSSRPAEERAAYAAWTGRLADLGEPILTYIEPATLAADLRAFGFSEVEDLTARDVKARFFAGHSLGLPETATSHLIRARV